jgi:hypothetical protein
MGVWVRDGECLKVVRTGVGGRRVVWERDNAKIANDKINLFYLMILIFKMRVF